VSGGSESVYNYLYEGRYARQVRLLALLIIAGSLATSRPHPGLSGHGLVILISLIVVVVTQLIVVASRTGPGVLVRTVLGALSCGILVGFDPSVGTAILLIFVGLDAGASLEFGRAGLVTGLAAVTTALGVLASGMAVANISLGSVALLGFLAAAGRRQYMLRADEAELRLADVERAREEHARAAGLAERANAAREIHDILAHSLGALVLQLDALDAVLGAETTDQGRAVELLARARALAVEGLSEARQAVGTLRTNPPSLNDALRQLVENSGVGTLEISGTPWPLTAEVTVALRRTAQEGLTNAVKHAPGATPRVQLTFTTDHVELTVTDIGRADGTAPGSLADIGGGYGIEGLRERAELLGGTLVAGPLGSGWQVRLCVPHDRALSEQKAT